MAISVIAGTPVASGSVNVNTLSVAYPAAAANTDFVFIPFNANWTGGAVDTPAGWSVLVPKQQMGTISSALSGNCSLYVYYRQGPFSAGTAVFNATGGGVGRAAAVPFKMTGVDATTPIQGTGSSAPTLAAPGKTSTTAPMYVACWGVREGDTHETSGTTTITVPAGMTALGGTGGISSTVAIAGNEQAIAQAAYQSITAGSTVTAKTATTNAVMGTSSADYALMGAASFLVNAAAVSSSQPDVPVISVTPGNTQNVVSWTAPANNGSAITGYTLQRQTYVGGVGQGFASIGVGTITSASTSFTDTGLTNNTQYGYQLLATNALGSSAYSTEVTGTPAAASASGYTATVLATNPEHYWPFNIANGFADIGKSTTKINFTNLTGTVPVDATTVNGTSRESARFSGSNAISAPTSPDFSVTKTEQLTVMMYVTVDDYTTFSDGEYTHFIGKGRVNGQFEWAGRFYEENVTNRPARKSCYYYPPDPNVTQGLGSGAFAQPLPDGTDGGGNVNISATSTFNTTLDNVGQEHILFFQFNTDGTFGNTSGGIRIFWFNTAVNTQAMNQTAPVVPGYTTGPLYIGILNHGSFKGRIRRVATWTRLLSQTEINTLVSARATAEGGNGSVPAVAPSQPNTVRATRSGADSSIVNVTWAAPTDNGGAAIQKYTVSFNGGGVTDSLDTANGTTFSATLTGVPQVATTVSVVAVNTVGTSTPGQVTVPAAPALNPIGAMSDTFNANDDLSRTFYGGGVARVNNQVEWATVDTTKRGTYVRGDMRGQSAFHRVGPDTTTSNVVTCMFVRSSADVTKQIRIAFLNGSVTCRFDDNTPDATPTTTAYSAATMRYWRIADVSGTVSLQYSADGLNWASFPRSGFATPAWFNDVRVGVEAYTGTSV